jgi:hypothetical protein
MVKAISPAPVYVLPDGRREPLRVLKVGTQMTVLGSEDGGWYQVQFSDQQWGTRIGFIDARLVTKVAAPSPPMTVASSNSLNPDTASHVPVPGTADTRRSATLSTTMTNRAPGRLPVVVVSRASNQSNYSFVVPGYVSTRAAAAANCFGTTNGSLTSSTTRLGDFYDTQGTYQGNTNVDCSANGSSVTTVKPPEQVSYAVSGATLSLRLLDGRVAVVNCNAKPDWASLGKYARSCRVPSTDQFEAEFHGDDAKLFWRIGVYGEKVQSETYKLIEILSPIR